MMIKPNFIDKKIISEIEYEKTPAIEKGFSSSIIALVRSIFLQLFARFSSQAKPIWEKKVTDLTNYLEMNKHLLNQETTEIINNALNKKSYDSALKTSIQLIKMGYSYEQISQKNLPVQENLSDLIDLSGLEVEAPPSDNQKQSENWGENPFSGLNQENLQENPEINPQIAEVETNILQQNEEILNLGEIPLPGFGQELNLQGNPEDSLPNTEPKKNIVHQDEGILDDDDVIYYDLDENQDIFEEHEYYDLDDDEVIYYDLDENPDIFEKHEKAPALKKERMDRKTEHSAFMDHEDWGINDLFEVKDSKQGELDISDKDLKHDDLDIFDFEVIPDVPMDITEAVIDEPDEEVIEELDDEDLAFIELQPDKLKDAMREMFKMIPKSKRLEQIKMLKPSILLGKIEDDVNSAWGNPDKESETVMKIMQALFGSFEINNWKYLGITKNNSKRYLLELDEEYKSQFSAPILGALRIANKFEIEFSNENGKKTISFPEGSLSVNYGFLKQIRIHQDEIDLIAQMKVGVGRFAITKNTTFTQKIDKVLPKLSSLRWIKGSAL